MIARYAISIGLGAGVTFGLLFLMQLLIATGQGALTESSTFRVTDFVRVERNEIVETKKDKPEKPPEPEKPVAVFRLSPLKSDVWPIRLWNLWKKSAIRFRPFRMQQTN